MVIFGLIFSGTVLGQNNPVELGNVNWYRNYEKAVVDSKELDKPLFILFQEVPGCNFCKHYGENVLSNPLIVEALEDLFIPLAIYNNKQGQDEKILKQFNEPSWNNPVARVLSSEGHELQKRLDGQYSPYEVVQFMINALIADKREIPLYLVLLLEELQAKFLGTRETYISMFCYWSGEKNIAKQKGVIFTEAGFMDGKEVVKVIYAPSLVDYSTILERAEKANCASGVFTDDSDEQISAKKTLGKSSQANIKAYQKADDDKYYLSKSNLKNINLTDLQKTRINSMLGEGLDVSNLLSPRQKAELL